MWQVFIFCMSVTCRRSQMTLWIQIFLPAYNVCKNEPQHSFFFDIQAIIVKVIWTYLNNKFYYWKVCLCDSLNWICVGTPIFGLKQMLKKKKISIDSSTWQKRLPSRYWSSGCITLSCLFYLIILKIRLNFSCSVGGEHEIMTR